MNFVGYVAISFSLLLAGAPAAFAQNVHGILRVVKGDVQIKSAAKNGELVKARIGEKVFPKDVIITGKDARAKIVMVDNNEINVSPDSQIEIQHYEYDPGAGKKDVLLNVIYGKVRSKVEQKYDGKTTKFQIKTPSAVAGVRGTDFITGYTPSTNTSQITTFQGRVEFGLPGPGNTIINPVAVTPGMQATNVGGQAPGTPAPVPKEELAKIDKDSRSDIAPAPNSDGAAAKERTPANDGKDKKDDGAGKNDKAPAGDKSSGAKGNPPPPPTGDPKSGNSSAANDGVVKIVREPANAAGPSNGSGMMRPNDFVGGAGSTPVMPVVNTPNIPSTGLPPNVANIIKDPCDVNCKNHLQQSQTTKLNITVH